jgi:hypothetical protein
MATSANRATRSGSSGTALRGQIDAIGIFDLLRIAITQQGTGRLLLSNDEMTAALYYEQGRLTAVVSGVERGTAVLSAVLTMQRGEFEYVRGNVSGYDPADETLHDVLLAAIEQYQRERLDSRRGTTESQSLTYTSGVHPVSSRSVDSGWPDPAQDPSSSVSLLSNPVASEASHGFAAAPSNQRPVLARGEHGRALTDSSGRVFAKVGQIVGQETNCVVRMAKLSYDLATILGMENLQRFEINRSSKALLCRMTKGGILVARVGSAPDLEAVWQGLEP